ncbi:response regulator [Thermaerobacter composti]|uniref:Stage 0 sporulation protein A homolog n=1 Tax=Thermaerobacter composti TaxID=554949 RepID=A0ABZ0QQP6_9FIRM|nr:response regulator [Thermaerobacter composti]WPD18847.1 response regulator [Thermaerobacter composti]
MARILVADDAAFMRMRLANLLTEAGHTVLEATNGAEAVERYRQERPDLVLMDITMPVMDGLEAIAAIRAFDPGARIVVCSSLGQQAIVLKAIESGARDFIVKPFQPDRVLGAVERALSG